jgi:hypothetical protein
MSREGPCPRCESDDLHRLDDGSLLCRACGGLYSDSGFLCPVCAEENTTLAERCSQCGEPLTSLGRALTRHGDGQRPYKLDQVRALASQIRTYEEESSRRRFGALEEIDRVRIAAQAEAARAAADRDRRLFRTVFIASVVFLLLVALLVLLIGPL